MDANATAPGVEADCGVDGSSDDDDDATGPWFVPVVRGAGAGGDDCAACGPALKVQRATFR